MNQPLATGDDPLVTVIIPTRNRPERLREAIASVMAQTLQRFEIIVVNDAGVPVEAVLPADPRVRLVRAAGQRCMSGARNLGLRLARGRYVAYLDDDDFYHPEHLQTLVDAMEGGRNKVAYTFARRLHEREEGGRRTVVGEDVPWRHEFDRELLYATNYIPMLCLMHERACIDEVGPFDESLGVLEDWELWVRFAQRWDFRCVPRVTCTFTWRGNATSVTGERLKLFGYVGARVHRKHRDAVLMSPRALRTVGRMWLRSFTQQAELGQVDEAIAGLERFSADAPLWADAQVNLGVLYFTAGRFEEARAAAARAVAMDGSIPEARCNLASLELLRGRPDLALAAIGPRLAEDPTDAAAMFIAADALRAQGREGSAREAYEAVLELAPNHAGARERLALTAAPMRFAAAAR